MESGLDKRSSSASAERDAFARCSSCDRWSYQISTPACTAGSAIIDLRRNVQGSTQDRLYAQYTEICKLFVDKPHLRPYFYDNEPKPIVCPADRPSLGGEIDAMSETILGLIERAIVQHANLPRDSWRNCWQPYAIERVKKAKQSENSTRRTSIGMRTRYVNRSS